MKFLTLLEYPPSKKLSKDHSMFRASIIFLLILVLQLDALGQVEFVNSDAVLVENKIGEQLIIRKVINNADTTFTYHWSKEHPPELANYAKIEIWDDNAQYIEQLFSSCDNVSPNYISGDESLMDTNLFYVHIYLEELVPVDKMILFDSLTVKLLHDPNCEMILDELTFESSETTSLIELDNINTLIFPNPTEKYLYLEGEEFEEGSFSIFDVKGKLVQEGSVNENKIVLEFENNGIYFLKILNQSNEISTISFVKI